MIYLASASPRRRKLLDTLSISFDVHPVEADERPPRGVPVEQVPVLISKNKADACSDQRSDGVVLAADTVVAHEGQVIGKPSDSEEARRILKQLRGHSHQVITGVTAQRGGGASESITCVSQVRLRQMSDDEVTSYVSSGKPLDRAGGYGLQDVTHDPVDAVRGCRANVLGLPLCMVPDLLESFDVDIPGGHGVACRPDREQECEVDPCAFSD